LRIIPSLLLTALAFGQTEPPTIPQQQSATQQPANPQPTKPPSVADVARASKKAKSSSPPAKVYKNKDLRSSEDATAPATGEHRPAAATPPPTQTASHPPAQTTDEFLKRKNAAFEADGRNFKNQVLAQKAKIADIQNQIANLKDQFAAWSVDYVQDDDMQLCWSYLHDSPFYKGWCDTGRNLKAQYDASLSQLDQENGRLEQMQEAIRRKGYGNAVYDPD